MIFASPEKKISHEISCPQVSISNPAPLAVGCFFFCFVFKCFFLIVSIVKDASTFSVSFQLGQRAFPHQGEAFAIIHLIPILLVSALVLRMHQGFFL